MLRVWDIKSEESISSIERGDSKLSSPKRRMLKIGPKSSDLRPHKVEGHLFYVACCLATFLTVSSRVEAGSFI